MPPALTGRSTWTPLTYSFLRKKARDPYRSAKRLSVAGLKLDLGVASAGGSDSVRAYLKEIGRVRLLSGEQEVALARCVERGMAAAARLDLPPLLEPGPRRKRRRPSTPRDRLLREQPHEADERLRAEGAVARQVLVEANLRLVVSVAKWYPQPGHAVPRSDPGGQPGPHAGGGEVRLHQGLQVLDLCHLVDPPAISRAIADQARTIRIPVHMVDSINAVIRPSAACCRSGAGSPRSTRWRPGRR